MKTIFKFSVPIQDEFSLDLPRGAQILDVQRQGGNVQLWALVSASSAKTKRRFRLIPTGHPIKGRLGKYIKTFQSEKGALVFHLFEVT